MGEACAGHLPRHGDFVDLIDAILGDCEGKTRTLSNSKSGSGGESYLIIGLYGEKGVNVDEKCVPLHIYII